MLNPKSGAQNLPALIRSDGPGKKIPNLNASNLKHWNLLFRICFGFGNSNFRFSQNRRSLSLRRGAILIFTLWVLSFLVVLAANLGYGVRQTMTFMKRIEERSQMAHIAQGGVKVALALLTDDLQKSQFQYTPASKSFRHNNPARFADIRLVEGGCEISYSAVTDERGLEKRFGAVDEEGKINVNTADKLVLKRIAGLALSLDEQHAQKIAEAIFDWRQAGDSELKGFFSDDYYANLKYPYSKKDEPFELPDEFLLVKGIDRPMVDVLRNYLTVYGAGQVNINTASKPVLMALGLEEAVVDKILKVRRGNDGIEATLDDHIFYRSFDIAAEVGEGVKIEPNEMRAIDQLNMRGLLTTNSYYYTIQSNSFGDRSRDKKSIICVFNAADNRIVYWKEK